MSVFISHSFENKPEFDNVTDALALRGVAFWNPTEIRSGASLRDQLRRAVEQCEACIFIATRTSVNSSWCGAELGAFWGASKPIVVYLAEPSIPDADLPEIVKGDVWERRISRVAERAGEILAAGAVGPSGRLPGGDSPVSQLTVQQLERLIASAVSLAAASEKDKAPAARFDEFSSTVQTVAGKVLAGFQASEGASKDTTKDWNSQILWVDDRPENNEYERRAMESMGLQFTLARSTDEAMRILSAHRFAAVISDMGRQEGPREGYRLLDLIREGDKRTPFFIYAGSNASQHRQEAIRRGAQCSTNAPTELISLVTLAVRATSERSR